MFQCVGIVSKMISIVHYDILESESHNKEQKNIIKQSWVEPFYSFFFVLLDSNSGPVLRLMKTINGFKWAKQKVFGLGKKMTKV